VVPILPSNWVPVNPRRLLQLAASTLRCWDAGGRKVGGKVGVGGGGSLAARGYF